MSLVMQPNREVGFNKDNNLFVDVSVYRSVRVNKEDDVCGESGDSSDSSSIGVGGESSLSSSTGDDGGEDEVQSKPSKDSLESLDSLEDSLPIKRGLSNFFDGKSRSFASLSEAAEATTAASDLAKPENPFNKRRRILMACKSSWKRRASCTSLLNTSSLPGLHSLEENHREEEEEEEEEEEGEEEETPKPPSLASIPSTRRRLDAFRSPRCFSLCDLQQHAN